MEEGRLSKRKQHSLAGVENDVRLVVVHRIFPRLRCVDAVGFASAGGANLNGRRRRVSTRRR